ncbi:MAG: hypothetical protein JWO80_2553 [Bryobacterales bacterium]|nr:hypothetical protein [Bryobacterales bacterium]
MFLLDLSELSICEPDEARTKLASARLCPYLATDLLPVDEMTLAIRWTVGDVSSRGFDALALSIAGARTIFGPSAHYIVCVNTIDPHAARARVGRMADYVEWHDSSDEIPPWLEPHLHANMAEGVAWKFAPVGLFSERHVLSLDNDVILWRLPAGIRNWLDDGDSLLIAEDVLACYGQFASFCPDEPRNSGIVGFPPHYDVEVKLRALLDAASVRLSSETDEQGLQVALVTSEKHHVVSGDEVSICGYYRPHMLGVGSCGAHFVGLNVKHLPITHGFWDGKKAEVEQRVADANPAETRT